MKEPVENYAHLLAIDEAKRLLTIKRVYKDGTQQLFTSIDLPSKAFTEDEPGFREFARTLGENLLVDSPVARKLLGL